MKSGNVQYLENLMLRKTEEKTLDEILVLFQMGEDRISTKGPILKPLTPAEPKYLQCCEIGSTAGGGGTGAGPELVCIGPQH